MNPVDACLRHFQMMDRVFSILGKKNSNVHGFLSLLHLRSYQFECYAASTCLLYGGRPAFLVAESSGNHDVPLGIHLFIMRVCAHFLRNNHVFIMPSANNPPITSLCPTHHRQVLHQKCQCLFRVDPNVILSLISLVLPSK
jgi:hypothetical protein